jgi:hypothetical protein
LQSHIPYMVGPAKASQRQSIVRSQCREIIQKGLGTSLYYLSSTVKLTESASVDSQGKESYLSRQEDELHKLREQNC